MRPFLTLGLPFLATLAFGQATPQDDPIGTARPSFSDTSQIVPVGSLQLEAGLSFYRRGSAEAERFEFGEGLLRYGLRPRVELRLQLPNEVDLRRGGHGFDDASLAVSVYLGKFLGWDVGVIPGVEIPTGAREFRGQTLVPNASLNLARALGSGTLAGTLAAAYGRDAGRDDLSGLGSVVYSQNLRPAFVGFAEYAAFLDRFAEPEHYAHFGLQLIVRKTSQFDVHVGFGLGSAASRELVGAGYSVRF